MISFIVYATARSLFRVYFTLFYSLKVVGRENIPRRGAFIVAANHCSYFDPILLGVSTHRFLKYLARDTLFRTSFWAWAMRNVRAIPLHREAGDLHALRTSIAILRKGCPLVVFPEGTRSEDGTLRKARKGIGFLVAKTWVPVVPAYVGGTHVAFPKGAKKPRRYPIRVYFGPPVTFGGTAANGGKAVYERMSADVMDCIGQLKARYESAAGG